MKFRSWLRGLSVKGIETALLGIVSLILAAIIKGEPLKGLAKLSSLSRFLRSEVPLWSLIAAILVAIVASIAWLQKRTSKGRALPGLAHYRPSFNDYNYESVMDSQDLLLVFNDGRSWFPSHHEALERRIIGRGQKLRVLLIHPRSGFLPTLVLKEGRQLAEQQQIMYATFKLLSELKQRRPDLVEVRGHLVFNPYVLHLTERTAVVHPFFLNKRGELPIFVFNKADKDSLYEQYKADAEKLWEASSVLTEADFDAGHKAVAAGAAKAPKR